MRSRLPASGKPAGFAQSTTVLSASFMYTLYTTDGAVVIRSRLYSRSKRSCTISM